MGYLFRRGVVLAGIIYLVLWIEKGKLMQPSTWTALVMAYKKYGPRYFLDGRAFNILAYGRWLPNYIAVYQRLMKGLGPRAQDWMVQTYHGKVLTTELAKDIISLDVDIPLRDLGTKIIPYRTAREFLLEAHPDIALTECACRAVSDHGCKPSQVCMAIGHPFTDFVLQHRPETTRRITKEEALDILDDASRRGLVHHAYFKDAAFNQFYALCNCCPECCTGFMAKKLGVDMICGSGYQCQVTKKSCKGSGECVKACPFEAVSLVNGKSVVDPVKCMGCGVCIAKCPNNARKLIQIGPLEPLSVRDMLKDLQT